MLSLEFCRERQKQLLAHLNRNHLTAAILSSSRAIHYYSGVLVDPQWPQALVISNSGDSTLISGKEPDCCASSAVRAYTGYAVDRFFDRSTMQEELNRHVIECLPSRAGSLAVELEFMQAGLLSALSMPVVNITPWWAESGGRHRSGSQAARRVSQ